jgi:uncharacterized protein YgiM (DUF1202 family)
MPLHPHTGLAQGFDAAATVTALVETREAIHLLLTATTVAANGSTPAPAISNRSDELQVEVLVAGLNVREGPGTTFPVLDNVPAGSSFTIVGRAGNCAWLKVRDGNQEIGWISGGAQYVRYTVPCASIPFVP